MGPGLDKARFGFLDGAIVERTTIRLIGVQDDLARSDVPHGSILTRRGDRWLGIEVGERLVSCTATAAWGGAFIAVAESGREVTIDERGVTQGLVAIGEHSPASNGPLTAVRACGDGPVFCVGTARQAYRKAGTAGWARVDQTCKPDDAEARSSTAFLAVDGFSGEDVYAVGWNGEIWRFDGSRWDRVASPTTLALHGVHCAADRSVYACGQGGILLEGRGSVWSVLAQSSSGEDLRSVCLFEGVLYACSASLVYRWQDGALRVVEMEDPVSTAGRLVAAEDRMLSVGRQDVALFDGDAWHRVL